MQRFTTAIAAAAFALGVLQGGLAQAATLWSNLPVNGARSAGISSGGSNAAMGFTVPTGPDYALDSVTLYLGNAFGDTPLVRLYSDDGANPDTALATFANPVIGTDDDGEYTFDASPGTMLSADMSYWIVVQSTSGIFNWRRNDPSVEPTGIFDYLGTRFNGDPPTDPADGFHYGIELAGAVAAVPLPASVLLLLSALGAAGFVGRRAA